MERTPADIDEVVRRALAEDVGSGDVTTMATVPPGARATARITQKADGVLSGLDVAEAAFQAMDPDVGIERLAPEGEWRTAPQPVLQIDGDAAAILAAERTALNLLQRMSGIATLTHRYVEAVAGTGVQILDTRKTTPGLRALEKAAVRAGGGVSHRFGLFDMVLIKENHAEMAGGVGNAVTQARQRFPDLPLEVECRTPEEVAEALGAGAPRILLDNMGPDALRAAVAQNQDRAILEASGGITLATIRDHAVPGLQFISVGALTHSAPALDLSLILEPSP